MRLPSFEKILSTAWNGYGCSLNTVELDNPEVKGPDNSYYPIKMSPFGWSSFGKCVDDLVDIYINGKNCVWISSEKSAAAAEALELIDGVLKNCVGHKIEQKDWYKIFDIATNFIFSIHTVQYTCVN